MPRDRILVVDDDTDVLESLHDELRHSFDVDAVDSGGVAIERLKQSAYDAIIADLRMPEISGIEVLDWAKKLHPEAIRIILTGHLDENARQATRGHDAPFKISKPWHDAVEVTLRRAFEHRERMRKMNQSFTNLLQTADVDDELAAAEGLAGIARILVTRAERVNGILGFQIVLNVEGHQQTMAGFGADGIRVETPGHWRLTLPLTRDSRVQVTAHGIGEAPREIVEVLVGRAQRWATDLSSPGVMQMALNDPVSRAQLFALNRRASLGAMATSILHELASLAQNIQLSIDDLAPFVRREGKSDSDLQDSLEQAVQDSRRVVDLFRSLRTFVQHTHLERKPCPIRGVVDEAVRLCSSYARKRHPIVVTAIGDASVEGDHTALVQVMVNILRNAAEASTGDGAITLSAQVQDHEVAVSVSDNGPGVPAAIRDRLFEPFVTTKPSGSGCGLGLAVASRIVQDHRGRIAYEDVADGGARFTVFLPCL